MTTTLLLTAGVLSAASGPAAAEPLGSATPTGSLVLAAAAPAGPATPTGPTAPTGGATPASPAGVTPTGIAIYDIDALGNGPVPARPAVVSARIGFNPTSTVLALNGVSYGSAPSKVTDTTGTTLSWVLDLSMVGGSTVSVRVTASGTKGATYNRTVAAVVASEGARTTATLGPAGVLSPQGTRLVGPLQYLYATPTSVSTTGLTSTSSYKTSKSGDVRQNLSIDAGSAMAVVASNAVDAGIATSRVLGAVGSSSSSAFSRVLVRDSMISAGNNTAVNGSVNLVNSYVTSDQDGVHPLGQNPASMPSIIADNRIQRGGTSTAGTNGIHNDGIQMWKGSNVVISRNWISGWATSAIMLKTDQVNADGSTLNHVTIDDNYLATAGFFTLYIFDGGKGLPQYVTVTNNVFGPNRSNGSAGNVAPQAGLKFVRTEGQRTRAVQAGVAGAASWVVWSGNTDVRTGAEIAPPGGWLDYP